MRQSAHTQKQISRWFKLDRPEAHGERFQHPPSFTQIICPSAFATSKYTSLISAEPYADNEINTIVIISNTFLQGHGLYKPNFKPET